MHFTTAKLQYHEEGKQASLIKQLMAEQQSHVSSVGGRNWTWTQEGQDPALALA